MKTNQQTIAVIGVGNMGTAIIKGLINTRQFKIIGENPTNPRVTSLGQELGFTVVNNNLDVVKANPDFVILTTPAPITLKIAQELSQLPVSTTVISAAAGVSLQKLQSVIADATVAAMIPNTPVAVNAGTIGLTLPEEIPEENANKIITFLELLGDVIPVSEEQLEIVGVIGGCGPAFVDVFMDAMSDGAVANGMGRQTAYRLISSMVKGTGKLAFDTKKLPAELRDQVTSPAGTTIKGVLALEKNRFRYAVIDAINKAAGK
ncbi:pyrroline-5-carboxylate reductase [Limosilactobacillus portuensis]|jgi:pyrroline-5-carboxylate reductase|uniref:Pyrroline-5-carboxylate reductase n=1 Tax=Limosilactobacillus portuensis TaxID=2742601 RepID=A0ABS6ITK6_9LACO|nr:pyrroline-5-carboxylate reductase [Limosilactobacillus portuensis]MBU9694854.1 pyrroline-5-carboxylate reductase [Limosilactobacillus portuensis]PMC27915.1 pyrroline-5-carboxylate reductase [Gardnerella vaginalis]